jgi:Flp pilus assembly protein TadD
MNVSRNELVLKHSIPAILIGLLAFASEGCLWAQVSGPAKEAQPSSTPYSAEESGTVTAELGRKEADLRTALQQEPESAGLLYALALVLRQEGKARESLDTYTQGARKMKPTAEELRSVALDYVLLNDYDDAIHWLEVAAQIDPTDTKILYSLGRCYYSRDRYLDAGKMYERILVIEPRNLKAEENLGLVYDATNDSEKAEEALRTAASWAEKNGKDEWPFLDLGSFLLDHDRSKEALDPLRIAVGIRPLCAQCHEKLGRALVETHDSAAGIAELQEATKLDPKDPKAHYELGRVLRQVGQIERAQEEIAISQKLYAAHSQE